MLWCDHSNEISLAVLSHGNLCFAGFGKKRNLAVSGILLWPLLGRVTHSYDNTPNWTPTTIFKGTCW